MSEAMKSFFFSTFERYQSESEALFNNTFQLKI